MDRDRSEAVGRPVASRAEQRLHPRVPLRTGALVHQPSLWPEPFEVVAENVSLGGALFTSDYLFSPYDYFHCRVMLSGSGAVAGREVRVSAVVVRVADERWEKEGRCSVGAFFVGLDERDEEAIQEYVRRTQAPEPTHGD